MGTNGNKVSAMFAQLATDVDDVGERVAAISLSTAGAKEDHNALGARTLTNGPNGRRLEDLGLAMRTYSAMNLADRHRPIHNLVISNVPGPPFPLYLAGRQFVAAYPMGPIMDGAGLNVTVLSYREHVDIGFMASADLVPDVWTVAAQVEPAFEELKALAAEKDPTLVKKAAPVTTIPATTRRAAGKAKTVASRAPKAPHQPSPRQRPRRQRPAPLRLLEPRRSMIVSGSVNRVDRA